MINIQPGPSYNPLINRIRQRLLINTLPPSNIHNPHPPLHHRERLPVQKMMRLRRMRTRKQHTVRHLQHPLQVPMIHRTPQRPLHILPLPPPSVIMNPHPNRPCPLRNRPPDLSQPNNPQHMPAWIPRDIHSLALDAEEVAAPRRAQHVLAETRVPERRDDQEQRRVGRAGVGAAGTITVPHPARRERSRVFPVVPVVRGGDDLAGWRERSGQGCVEAREVGGGVVWADYAGDVGVGPAGAEGGYEVGFGEAGCVGEDVEVGLEGFPLGVGVGYGVADVEEGWFGRCGGHFAEVSEDRGHWDWRMTV